jgi:hypothetical protein
MFVVACCAFAAGRSAEAAGEDMKSPSIWSQIFEVNFEHGQWVLPDSFVIGRGCEALRRLANAKVSSQQYDHSEIARLATEIEALCAPVKEEETTPDEWMRRASSIEHRLRRVALCAGCRAPMLKAASLRPRQPIPADFVSYTLFLTPNDAIEASSRENVMALRYAFIRFGEAIGDRRAAIWFDPEDPLLSVAYVAVGIGRAEVKAPYSDVLRSKAYCDRFGLDYNNGPYVITTLRRPDQVGEDDEKVVIRMNGVSPDGMVRILNLLEQDLRKDREIRQRQLIFEEIKQRILQIFRGGSSGLGDAQAELIVKAKDPAARK